MCAIDGQVEIIFVPHINRQEVYAGKRLNESIYDEYKYMKPGMSEETFPWKLNKS